MKPKYNFFLSSTSDLEALRKALRAELPHYVSAFDYTLKGAEDVRVKDVLLAEIKKAHVFVGLVGCEWGSACPADWDWPRPEPKYPDPDRPISYVEWEVLTARGVRRARLMMFVQNLDGQSVADEQRQFISYLNPTWSPRFATPDELKSKFWISFNEWRDDLWEQSAEAETETSKKFFPAVAAMAVAALLLVPAALLLGVAFRQLLVTVLFAFGVIALCFLFMWSQTGGFYGRRQRQ